MITVRALAGRHEYADAVQLQRMVWGWEDLDILPVRFFVVARDIGGQVLGAFDGDFMCGFCVAIPGVHPSASNHGAPYLHSHMLGVLPEYRDAGAGRMLKLAQRKDALARGFDLVEWTFDPLELKNAYFNIEKLGAVIRHYFPNHYGITTSSLGGGLPTDRCLAEWHLNRPRQELTTLARVPVPTGLDRLRRTDPAMVLEVQQRVAHLFQENLASGLAVTGFERSIDSGIYLFSSWPSE
jgi:predicted GNAT superfamily acetyltransferase